MYSVSVNLCRSEGRHDALDACKTDAELFTLLLSEPKYFGDVPKCLFNKNDLANFKKQIVRRPSNANDVKRV